MAPISDLSHPRSLPGLGAQFQRGVLELGKWIIWVLSIHHEIALVAGLWLLVPL
jgi:hypothetical protein